MYLRAHTPLVLYIIALMVVVGMPLMLATPMHHEIGCPFSGTAAMCSVNPLEHVRHWQIAFATILVEMLAMAALAIAASREWRLLVFPELHYARIRLRSRRPVRPTLFQELYSCGILNRKEPPVSFV